MEDFSIGEVIGYGWNKVKEQKWFWPGVALITFVISGIGSEASKRMGENSGGAILINLVMMVINIIIGIGVIKLALKQIDGQKLEYSELFANAKYFPNYFAASLIIGLITFVGFLLLIIPGIYWAIKYSFATYLIVDKNMSISEAMKKSGEMTKGKKMNLFVLGICYLGVIILGALVIGIGLLWAMPVVWISMAYVYRKLLKDSPAPEAPAPAQA